MAFSTMNGVESWRKMIAEHRDHIERRKYLMEKGDLQKEIGDKLIRGHELVIEGLELLIAAVGKF